MKKLIRITVSILIVVLSISFTKGHNVRNETSDADSLKVDMDGWFKAGSKPGLYEIGLEEEKYNGKPIYYLRSTENVENGFGTIMKQIKPDEYLSKRIRMTGYIKSEKIELYAGMWMRVDGYAPGSMLGFDNMYNRQISGTTDWQKYEIVLDVPDTSANIAYGVLFSGNGKIWISNLSFEEAGNDVPVTNMLRAEQVQVPLTESNFDLPPELTNVPDGIEVKHDPSTAYATKTKDDTAFYYWFYKTTLKAIKEDLEITEFGSYTWVMDHWQFSTVTGKPFEPKDFADWYNCKKGKLKKGHEYSDKSNWYRWLYLQRGKALWYYIGKNKKGELFKGVSIVDYLPEMKK